jgi:spore germination cell wall hydrolase CwlJ-like protein
MQFLIQMVIALVTIAMEAGAEIYRGQLAVAWTLKNRGKREGSLTDVCLRSAQFSCWDTKSPTRMNIDNLTELQLGQALRAQISAWFEWEPDPTNGAIFYLNAAAVIRQRGKLPDWWDIDGDPATEIKIGNHTFRCKRKR